MHVECLLFIIGVITEYVVRGCGHMSDQVGLWLLVDEYEYGFVARRIQSLRSCFWNAVFLKS